MTDHGLDHEQIARRQGVCGPYVCNFPHGSMHSPGTRWTCSNCGTTYRLTKPKRARWWRNWDAPYGYWRRVRA